MFSGYILKLEWFCSAKHKDYWYSPQIYGSGFAINYVLDTALIVSGWQINQFQRSVYRNQRLYAIPTIEQEFVEMRDLLYRNGTVDWNLWYCNLVIRVKYIFTFHQEFCARFWNPPIKCLIPSFFPHSKTSSNFPSHQSGVQEIILVLQKESIMTQNSVMPMLKTVSTTSVYSHHYIEARSLIYNANRKT